jgi:hypothetical protein
MEIKKEIESLLEDLKNLNWGRKEIEREFEYNPNYISQALSRGGNQKLLLNLRKLKAHLVNDKDKVVKPAPAGDKLNRERALLKVLLHEVARLKAKDEGITFADALAQLKQSTNLVLEDLEL